MKHSKNYNSAKAMIDGNKKYSPLEACELAKKTTTVKYDATIRASFKLNVDPRQADQQIRGAIVLPNGTGRSQKVLVVTQGANMEVAKNAGADFVGDKEILEKIKGGWFDYDVIVATPDMMGELGKLGKILGPKGLMPNPKTGTVTPNIANAVDEIKKGKVTYRVDKEGNINCLIGKSSFDAEKLAENFSTLLGVIIKARPAAVKGNYIQSCTLSSNMGPGIKVDTTL
ncbi:MAG: 50S ribosomal protein L1 [Erysipelotrichaceae bacterium]|jgi:large subunit ribosomal protein L1|nr:50S ribosomal protein L1 [Erysipelotrichaceae bacterium]